MKEELKAIDFFSGAGGLTYGLRQAGILVVAGLDNDKTCKATYEKNNPRSVFLEKDVTKYSPEELENDLKLKRNDDALLFAGCAPCQYWSIIHTTKEKSKKTKDLILDFQKYIEYFLPGFILVENVPGISSKTGSPMVSFIKTIKKLGYVFMDHDVVDMSKHGIPQKRRRFTLLASRIAEVSLPRANGKKKTVKDVLGERNGFPKIPAGTKDSSRKIHTAAGLNKTNLERLKMTPPDGGDRTGWQKKKKYALACFSSNSNKFPDTYGRMWWNRPSPTITTKFYSISNGRFAHPEEDRGISLREGASLQTFPKDYEFVSTNTADIAKMIGNAVPPEFAKILGEQVVMSFNNKTKHYA